MRKYQLVMILLVLLLVGCGVGNIEPEGKTNGETVVLDKVRVPAVAEVVDEPLGENVADMIEQLQVGLVYQMIGGGFYQIGADGEHRQLLDEQMGRMPSLLLSPSGKQAAYLDANRQLWLVDLALGEQKTLGTEFNLSDFLMWGDDRFLLVGVWLDPNEADGPNNGHISIVDTKSGQIKILDEANLFGNRPAFLAKGSLVAYSVFSPDYNGRIYNEYEGIQVFDTSVYKTEGEMIVGGMFNPSWSSDGRKIAWLVSSGDRFAVQIFDLDKQTAMQVYDWDPARFGGLVPSPMWSFDGNWLLLDIVGNGEEGSGLWLLATDGSEQRLVTEQGYGARWLGFNQLVANVDNVPHLYDMVSGDWFSLGLPIDSVVVSVAR
ncbi:MAG TPA: hypothetical protein VLL52_14850 [Anaerolineae bacterium]|nr:hypothetical protein [Anaerolineae bacterium]